MKKITKESAGNTLVEVSDGKQTLTFVTHKNVPDTTMHSLDDGRSTIVVEISCYEFNN